MPSVEQISSELQRANGHVAGQHDSLCAGRIHFAQHCL